MIAFNVFLAGRCNHWKGGIDHFRADLVKSAGEALDGYVALADRFTALCGRTAPTPLEIQVVIAAQGNEPGTAVPYAITTALMAIGLGPDDPDGSGLMFDDTVRAARARIAAYPPHGPLCTIFGSFSQAPEARFYDYIPCAQAFDASVFGVQYGQADTLDFLEIAESMGFSFPLLSTSPKGANPLGLKVQVNKDGTMQLSGGKGLLRLGVAWNPLKKTFQIRFGPATSSKNGISAQALLILERGVDDLGNAHWGWKHSETLGLGGTSLNPDPARAALLETAP